MVAQGSRARDDAVGLLAPIPLKQQRNHAENRRDHQARADADRKTTAPDEQLDHGGEGGDYLTDDDEHHAAHERAAPPHHQAEQAAGQHEGARP